MMLNFSRRLFSESTKRSKPEYIYGVNPVLAALSAKRRFNTTLYLNISEKGERKSSDKMNQIARMASSQKMKVKFLTKMGLQKFTNGRPTQNVVMKCDKMQYEDIRSINDIPFTSEEGKFILFLD
jgi:tRNA G18 (ribose-2'-O)-methylase SpoU